MNLVANTITMTMTKARAMIEGIRGFRMSTGDVNDTIENENKVDLFKDESKKIAKIERRKKYRSIRRQERFWLVVSFALILIAGCLVMLMKGDV